MYGEPDKGLIFDIERFSTADGPGIRTVLFFKGCNLRCYWCHNPESIRREPELELDENQCIHCQLCQQVCPNQAHEWNPEHLLHRERCGRCFSCSEICPAEALKRVGNWMDVEACMQEIRQDLPFYRQSGGGITLSGGEVLLQHGFAASILARCKEEGISTAIESNLCVPKGNIQPLLPNLDLVMADIKHMDPQKHRLGTGASNALVLENIRWLDSCGVPMIIRTPIIPGYNDDGENMEQTALFLKECVNLRYYELLSYNPMGNDKRRRFGYQIPDIEIPEREKMKQLAEIARRQGLPVWIDGTIFA